jgi:hypothetical protein
MTPYFDTNYLGGLLLAATRPGYTRLERQAFGSRPSADDIRHVPPRTFRSPPGGTMFQSPPGRLAGLHRRAQRDALTRTARLSRAGRRLSRLAAAAAAATIALLASAAAIPAAFAQQTQATVHHTAASGGGLASWQIALIGIGVPLAATAVIVLVRLVQAAHRAAPSPNA